MGKKLFLVMAVGALFSSRSGDCLSATMTLDQQSMQCCGSMPCTPANHPHSCTTNDFRPDAEHVASGAHLVAPAKYRDR